VAKDKKKAPAPAPDVQTFDGDVEAAIAAVTASYGGVVSTGQSLLDQKRMLIPVSPTVDQMVGGGILGGSWVTLTGDEGLGKTVTALSFAANCQKPQYGSRPVFYYAAEHRLKSRDLRGIRGLQLGPSQFHPVQSHKGHILSSKDFLNIATDFIKQVPGSVHIIDSLSALVNPKVLEEGLGTEDRGAGYKLVGQFVDINQAIVPVNDCIVMGVAHLIANTGAKMGAPSKVEKLPRRWRYQTDVWLRGKWAEPWRAGANEDAEQIGQIVHWFLAKSQLDVGVGRKCASYMRYGVGLDRDYELLRFGKDYGQLGSSGAWLTFDFLKPRPELLAGTDHEGKAEVKVQGLENAYQLLARNPAWAQALQEAIHAMNSGGASEG
jgi:RecA/RadA recombinase